MDFGTILTSEQEITVDTGSLATGAALKEEGTALNF